VTARRGRAPVEPGAWPAALFGFAAVPTAAVLAGCLVGSALVAGAPGARGAAIGAVVVAGFFGVDLLLARLTTELDPAVTFLAFLGEYAFKIVLLGLLLVGLRERTGFSATALAVTVGAGTMTWVVGLVVAATRIRTYTLDGSDRE
jgi:ATP synthase protein I